LEQDNKLYAAAIHQAGHAVAALKLGLLTQVKSIRIDGTSPPFGQVEYSAFNWPGQNYKLSGVPFKKISKILTVFLAGPAAEAKYTASIDEQAANADEEEASKRVWQYSQTPGELLASLQRDASRLFTLKGQDTLEWQKVIRIADALMEEKKLTNQTILELYQQ
jgi:hypothetical protein